MGNDPKTTIAGMVTAAAWLLAKFGFNMDVEVQTAVITVGLFITSFFASDSKKPK